MIHLQLIAHESVWRDESYREPDFDPGLNFETRATLRAAYTQAILVDFKNKFANAIAAIKSDWDIQMVIESGGNDREYLED